MDELLERVSLDAASGVPEGPVGVADSSPLSSASLADAEAHRNMEFDGERESQGSVATSTRYENLKHD